MMIAVCATGHVEDEVLVSRLAKQSAYARDVQVEGFAASKSMQMSWGRGKGRAGLPKACR